MNITRLGAKVHELRGKRSLREFAQILGISHSYLDCIEKGYDYRTGKQVRISADVINKIAIGAKADSTELYRLHLLDSEEQISTLDAQLDFAHVKIDPDPMDDLIIDIERFLKNKTEDEKIRLIEEIKAYIDFLTYKK